MMMKQWRHGHVILCTTGQQMNRHLKMSQRRNRHLKMSHQTVLGHVIGVLVWVCRYCHHQIEHHSIALEKIRSVLPREPSCFNAKRVIIRVRDRWRRWIIQEVNIRLVLLNREELGFGPPIREFIIERGWGHWRLQWRDLPRSSPRVRSRRVIHIEVKANHVARPLRGSGFGLRRAHHAW